MDINIKQLSESCQICYKNSLNNRDYTPAQRQKWLVNAKVLKSRLSILISAQFDLESNEQVAAANTQLQAVTERLKNELDSINNTQKVFDDIANLTSSLDSLIKIISFRPAL